LLSALVHFFENGRWGSLIETAIEGLRLTEEDQLFVLMQAGLYLTAMRGMGSPEARTCYERAEPSLLRPSKRPKRLLKEHEQRDYSAELHRLRGVFLATLGAEEAQIEASFCEAIRIAQEQKSVSLQKRAEATYAEYRRQKISCII
jgi:hypothetical protein